MWITTNWKILKEIGIQDHLTCLLRSLYAGQEATVRTGHGTMDWFQIGKGVCQGCILSPWLFNFYVDCIMWNAELDDSQAINKIAGRYINNLRCTDNTTIMAESKEELKNLLKNYRREWKRWLKILHSKNEYHHIWSPPFMANRWRNNGSRDFIWGGSKITADSDCSHEIKRSFFLGRKAMTNLDSILKFRNRGQS